MPTKKVKKFAFSKIDRKKAKKIAIIAGIALLAAVGIIYAVKFFRNRAAGNEAYEFGFKASFEVSMLRSCIEASRGQAEYCSCYTESFVESLDEGDWRNFMGIKSPQDTMRLIERDASISGKIRIAMADCVDRVRLPRETREERAVKRASKRAPGKAAARAATLKGASIPNQK
jgi:hypothetical protein